VPEQSEVGGCLYGKFRILGILRSASCEKIARRNLDNAY
jgi:hypothetical protein